MIAFSFRAKILLTMMVLIVGVTVTMLVITDKQVQVSYERHFQQAFEFQMESFLQQREARLTPVKQRVAEAAGNPRLIAAMENAGQVGADLQDIDDLYQNGLDQLSGGLNAHPAGRTNFQSGLFFFLDNSGKVLYPRPSVELPFLLSKLQGVALQAGKIGQSVVHAGIQQVGYLTAQTETDKGQVTEMVFTPMVDPVKRQTLGVLAVGFPLPDTEHPVLPSTQNQSTKTTGSTHPMLSGILLENRLYSTSIPGDLLHQLNREIGDKLKTDRPIGNDFVVLLGDVPHQVYCQALDTGADFPPAMQICLYSLAEAQAEKKSFRQQIVISGTVALLGALALSLLISRGLMVPLRELVSGATQIEHGNYTVKVPVRSRDEIGHLAEAFNDMTEQVGASHVAQEQRIAERTEELAVRKRAEEALRQSESSLREAQRIAHLGNWHWNVATNELHWSDEIYSIFGLTPQQFGATYEAFLERVHSEDREKVRQAVRETMEMGKAYNLDHRVVRPGGEVRVVHERAEVIRNDSGKVQKMVGTVQNITEQKRIEAEFLRAQRLDGIGAIAGGMAHDLNNALSPILMGIQLIRRELKQPDMQQMLTVMEANTHCGADMVRQVLMFARGHESEQELLNVGGLIREMENIVRQTLHKSITVEAMVPSDLWPARGNPTQLHQVLLNLCVNARDAMPAGGELTLAADNVELNAAETKEIPGSTPGSYVMLLVSDTGTGIAPDILPRIFDAFFTTKGPDKGTGLGLSTIARIVRNHGGFVGVKSELGVGTTFEIYLPRAEHAPVPVAPPPGSPPAFSPGRNELILFIDDDRSVREMVGPALTDQGYRVLSAANGAEALALLDQHKDDARLVFTDIAMPVMDGVEMLAILRQRCPQLPVILMSGALDTGKQQLPPGTTAFLAKPFRLEQLLAAVAGALSDNPHRE
jgi:PAS domain S-box-containing protein